MNTDRNKRRKIRQKRVRARVLGTAARPRLAVFRSNKHITAQLINDVAGETLAFAGDTEVKSTKGKSDRASLVGQAIAEKAKAKKISKVIFDRAGYVYTGKVKALAEAARAGGLEF